MNELHRKGLYNQVMDLESNDKRTPVLCLLKSNALSTLNKRECFRKLVERYTIKYTDQVLKEIKNRNFEDLVRTKA